MNNKFQTAIFGGGCFWCTEAIFLMLKGVESVEPGYAGGQKPNPTYEQICTGKTGHAEVIKIIFNPEIISYENLLEVFFATHDSTTLNRQGNDIGTQYRSVVFYADQQQKAQAESFIAQVNEDLAGKVVTALEPLDVFYPAEDYHKNYYARNKDQAYCQVVINPKLEKFKTSHPELLKH